MDLQKCKAAVLTTPRLELRAVRADDTNDIITLANDFDIARRLTRMPHPYEPGDARYFIEHVLPNEAVWALIRKADGAFMGVISLMPRGKEGAVIVGYWLGRDYWGQGYMTEAATEVVRFAFETLKLSHLQSGHFADNAGSAAVLEKLGFVAVGKSHQYCLALNREVDHVDLRLEAADFLYKQTV
jgi:RimJ/RimL family protein N-acetyltransferase